MLLQLLRHELQQLLLLPPLCRLGRLPRCHVSYALDVEDVAVTGYDLPVQSKRVTVYSSNHRDGGSRAAQSREEKLKGHHRLTSSQRSPKKGDIAKEVDFGSEISVKAPFPLLPFHDNESCGILHSSSSVTGLASKPMALLDDLKLNDIPVSESVQNLNKKVASGESSCLCATQFVENQ